MIITIIFFFLPVKKKNRKSKRDGMNKIEKVIECFRKIEN